MANKYITDGFISVIVNGEKHNVAFKSTGFKAPWVQELEMDIPAIVKKEAPLMKKLEKAYKSGNEEEIAEIEAQCVLPQFLAGYVESGQKSNGLFDILDAKHFKIASIPDEAKPELAEENESLKAQLEEANAKLAQLEGTGGEGGTETKTE